MKEEMKEEKPFEISSDVNAWLDVFDGAELLVKGTKYRIRLQNYNLDLGPKRGKLILTMNLSFVWPEEFEDKTKIVTDDSSINRIVIDRREQER